MTTRLNRRRFLTALGLGAGSLYLPSLAWRRRVKASDDVPVRVVFFITGHGSVPQRWQMRQPGMDGVEYAYDLTTRAEEDWSDILRPLYRHRNKLLVVDNLAQTTAYAQLRATGGNAHFVAEAHLLTQDYAVSDDPLYRRMRGGRRSLDYVIGDAITPPGRWPCRVYGGGMTVSYVASNEPAPKIETPRAAFREIFDVAAPAEMSAEPTREDLIRAARGSVLDLAAQEFNAVLPRLGAEDRDKLERHRQLIRDLELSLSVPTGPMCNPSFEETGHQMSQWARLIALAFSCDLTRVVTLQPTGITKEEWTGGEEVGDVHQDVAHACTPEVDGYNARAENLMTNLVATYARHLATLLDELDSIPEAGGTMLDNTVVVWLTDLGTGTHWHDQLQHVLAGGAAGYFRTGRYVYFPADQLAPKRINRGDLLRLIGPAQSHLYVNIMHAVGMTDRDSFGMGETTDSEGTPISLRGPLPLLST